MEKGQLIILSLLLAILIVPAAYGKTSSVDPGITPDSPWYFLDQWGEKLGLLIAFGPDAKAEKALQYAEEKIAEAQAMANVDKGDDANVASEHEEEYIADAQEQMQTAETKGQDITTLTQKLEDITDRHLDVLQGVYDRVPDETKDSIAKVMEKVRAHHERMLEKLVEHFQNDKLNRDEVEKQLQEEIDNADKTIDERLAALEERVNTKQDQLDEKQAEAEARILERKKKWEERLAELQGMDEEQIQGKLDQLDEKSAEIEKKFNEFRSRLQERFQEQQQRILNSNSNVNTSDDETSDVNKNRNANSNVNADTNDNENSNSSRDSGDENENANTNTNID